MQYRLSERNADVVTHVGPVRGRQAAGADLLSEIRRACNASVVPRLATTGAQSKLLQSLPILFGGIWLFWTSYDLNSSIVLSCHSGFTTKCDCLKPASVAPGFGLEARMQPASFDASPVQSLCFGVYCSPVPLFVSFLLTLPV